MHPGIFKKSRKVSFLIFFLVMLFVFEPVGIALAQQTNTQTNTQTSATSNDNSAQGSGLGTDGKPIYRGIPASSDKTYEGAGTAALGSAASCSVGQIAGSVIGKTLSAAVSSMVKSVTGGLGASLTGSTERSVPTNDRVTRSHTGHVDAKETGGAELGIWDTFLNSLSAVSLDSIGFCIANAMIEYIGKSTIAWINSGFKGNPVFVDKPEQFFQNMADQEAGNFIGQLSGEVAGINICQPFRVQLALDTIGAHNSNLQNNRRGALNCSLSQIEANYERFAGGDWNSGGLPGWFEIIQPQNNIYGARQLANQERLVSISKQQNTATVELNWAKGYKNFKVCDTEEDSNGNCQKRPNGATGERTTTLGGYIEHNVNSRADGPQHRLEIADEFDEIVSALVNQLIKIAINKAFEDDGADKSGN